MPVLFIGHGSPENIVLDNDFTRALKRLGRSLPKPKAILVVSAHWLTDGTYVTCVEKPRTIYDFYGSPSELYRVTYPSPGSPQHAKTITELVENAGVQCDFSWGLDHASWAILKHTYPQADIPVIQMSLDYSTVQRMETRSLGHYYDIAKQLGPLREEDVPIIGSWNIVQNLRVADMYAMDAKTVPVGS